MTCGIDDTKPSLRGEYDHDIEECRRVIGFRQAQVARLEAELAARIEGAGWLRRERNEARAANAAKDAALERLLSAIATSLGSLLDSNTVPADVLRPACEQARAALSDAGKGWLEVRGWAESLAEVFREDDRDEQDCRICGVVGHDHCAVPDFLAALDSLKGK